MTCTLSLLTLILCDKHYPCSSLSKALSYFSIALTNYLRSHVPRNKFILLSNFYYSSSWWNTNNDLFTNLKLDRAIPLMCIALLSIRRSRISNFYNWYISSYKSTIIITKSEHYLATQTISLNNHLIFIFRLY